MKNNTAFNNFVRDIKLKSIFISELQSKRNKSFHLPASIRIKSEGNFKNLKNNIIEISVNYLIEAIPKGKKKPGFKISVTYILQFESKVKMNEEFFKKFNPSVTLESWPYLRSLVNDLTMRMGLPPLVLRTFKMIPKQEGNSIGKSKS